MDLNEVSEAIIDAATKVCSTLGPGLLECEYEDCLLNELRLLGLEVKSQVTLPDEHGEIEKKTVFGLSIYFESDGESVNLQQEPWVASVGDRLDLLVEDSVIVELKSVKKLLPTHESQLLSYLKLSGKQVGLLINFSEPHLKRRH